MYFRSHYNIWHFPFFYSRNDVNCRILDTDNMRWSYACESVTSLRIWSSSLMFEFPAKSCEVAWGPLDEVAWPDEVAVTEGRDVAVDVLRVCLVLLLRLICVELLISPSPTKNYFVPIVEKQEIYSHSKNIMWKQLTV